MLSAVYKLIVCTFPGMYIGYNIVSESTDGRQFPTYENRNKTIPVWIQNLQ